MPMVPFRDRESEGRATAATEAAHYFGAGHYFMAAVFALLADPEVEVRGAARNSLDALETPSDVSRGFLLGPSKLLPRRSRGAGD